MSDPRGTFTQATQPLAGDPQLPNNANQEEPVEFLAHHDDDDEELDEDDDEVEEEEEEEEIEPKLSYVRLAAGLTDVFKVDAASCLAAKLKFLLLGTHSGKIFILDHAGNLARDEVRVHTSSVHMLSIDEREEYFASCSDDRAVIRGLYTNDNNTMVTSDRIVRCIAIDPSFSFIPSRRFVMGSDKVVLYEKGFITGYRKTILIQDEGQIRNIRWRGNLIAWSSDINVRVYDTEAATPVTLIRSRLSPAFRPELFRCSLCWQGDNRLLIGWADTLRVCHIKPRPDSDRKKNLPKLCGELLCIIETDFCIAGMGYQNDNVIVYAVDKAQYTSDGIEESASSSGPARRGDLSSDLWPQLKCIKLLPQSYIESFHDIITPRGYREYHCSDYQLDFVVEDGLFFIMCPKDVILAKPREDDDHITWLLGVEKYPEAMEAVKASKTTRKHSLYSVGKKYMDHLIEQSDTDPSRLNEAAALCQEFLGTNLKAWEEEVTRFSELEKLHILAPHLPRGPEFTLNKSVYQNVLTQLLSRDSEGFLEIVHQWPPNLYDLDTLISATLEKLSKRSGDVMLQEALGEMYCYQEKYEKAINIYLDIGQRAKEKIFALIHDHQLFVLLQNKMVILMEIDPDETARLLAEQHHSIPLEQVVPRLSREKPLYLWAYLNCVAHRDPESLPNQYHDLLVPLYAQFAPVKLLPFLRSSSRYSVEEALKICREKKLIKEIVYLLSRMGDTKKALEYITADLNDIHYAIEFCRENADPDLWQDLIDYSLQKPEFIRVLLQNIATDVPDPIGLINRIPGDKKIPGLVPALIKILHDYEIQISLEEGCRKVLVKDCFNMLQTLNTTQRRGMRISTDQNCSACGRIILPRDIRYAHGLVAFNCRHVFHKECLPSQSRGELICTTCIDANNKNNPSNNNNC